MMYVNYVFYRAFLLGLSHTAVACNIAGWNGLPGALKVVRPLWVTAYLAVAGLSPSGG